MAAEPIGSEFHDDRIWYLDRNSGLYGYLDTKGNVAIKSQFKTPVDFSDGLIPYYDESTRRYGYMAEDGTMIFKPQFAKAGNFSSDAAIAWKSYEWYIIDCYGNIVY